MSPKEKRLRRKALRKLGFEHGSFIPPRKKRYTQGAPSSQFKVCPACGERTEVYAQDSPGRCRRKTCGRAFGG
jgi:hypothetical protein